MVESRVAEVQNRLVSIHKMKLAEYAAASPARVPAPEGYSPKQAAVLEHCSKWDYGCQTPQVLTLAALLSDLEPDSFKAEVSKLRKSIAARPEAERSVELVVKGMFITVTARLSGWKMPLGSTFYVLEALPFTTSSLASGQAASIAADVGTRSMLHEFRYSPNADWKKYIRPATDEEIMAYLDFQRKVVELMPGKAALFEKIFQRI